MVKLTIEQLRQLRDMDPDGQDTEPTDEAYAQFEKYITETYGPGAIAQYYGNWEDA